MRAREASYAICVEDRGADDLEVRKVYRVLQDRDAAPAGYVRVIDESGDDYLYPARYFVPVRLPEKAKRAWPSLRRTARRGRSSGKPARSAGGRGARSSR